MTKTVQDIAPKILEVVQASKNILLHCHPSPDPDSVCSALAMKAVLEQMGKKVTIIAGDSKIPEAFSHFPGVSEITPKSFGEINTADFDLFIVQDSTMDRVTTKVPVVIPSTMKVAIIDHHISNVGGGNFNLIDASYPATGQLLADVFKVWGVTLDHDMAINLITGIFTDTGGFRYAATTPATFATAAELSILAPDYTGMIYKMDNANTAGNIRFQATALSSVKVELGGILAIATVSLDEMQNKQITLDDVNNRGISNALKSVVGWEVGVCATEIELGTTKVSFSTRNPQKFDLSVIAARCGGGGHKASAGAHMKMSLTEARQKIIDAVAASL